MKKQNKAHKIHTTKSHYSDIEKEQQIKELLEILKADQMKTFLRKYYKYAKDYKHEVVVEALNQHWQSMKETGVPIGVGLSGITIHGTGRHPNREISVQAYESVSGIAVNAQATRHDHVETLKKNAAFLIESSEKIAYDQETLVKMKSSFDRGEYDDVLDLACLYDRRKRLKTRSEEPVKEEIKTWKERLMNLVTEVEEEDVTHHLSCALREMNGPLTYESRALAKEHIENALRSENGGE